MQASKIQIGEFYAVNASPRKGYPEDQLHTLTANRIRVEAKGVWRFAENSDRGQIQDGIRGEHGTVYKARDFLLPWDEYVSRRDAWEAERAQDRAERAARVEAARERAKALRIRLREDFGIEATGDSIYQLNISVGDMERVLGSMSERLYEMLAEAS
jgi:hypothetical protein